MKAATASDEVWRNGFVKINRGREAGLGSEDRTDGETFTGTVWGDPVLRGVPGVNVNTVFFGPGGRTYWHSHERGQVLLATAGRGYVRTRAGDGGWVVEGDVVFAGGGEEHWHGAGGETFLVHTAVSLGETTWLEEVAEDDYRAAVGPGPGGETPPVG
jgi:quercetin dioxygenase-like cupin family protein